MNTAKSQNNVMQDTAFTLDSFRDPSHKPNEHQDGCYQIKYDLLLLDGYKGFGKEITGFKGSENL